MEGRKKSKACTQDGMGQYLGEWLLHHFFLPPGMLRGGLTAAAIFITLSVSFPKKGKGKKKDKNARLIYSQTGRDAHK